MCGRDECISSGKLDQEINIMQSVYLYVSGLSS